MSEVRRVTGIVDEAGRRTRQAFEAPKRCSNLFDVSMRERV